MISLDPPDDILIQAMEMKAYDEWRKVFFEKLPLIRERIAKNPKGQLAQQLIDADKNWADYNFSQKHEILEFLSHQICQLYEIPTVGIFSRNAYEQFCKENFGSDFSLSDVDDASHGHYFYHKAAGSEYLNITFPDNEFLSKEPFLVVTKTLFHELGHAIIDEYGRKISNKLYDYKKWTDHKVYLDQDYIEPLEVVGFLKFYEDRCLKMKRQRINKHNRVIENPITQSDCYEENATYFDYVMIWEERCADAFGYESSSQIKTALESIGHSPKWPEPSLGSTDHMIDKEA
jgi:hypothetical protein